MTVVGVPATWYPHSHKAAADNREQLPSAINSSTNSNDVKCCLDKIRNVFIRHLESGSTTYIEYFGMLRIETTKHVRSVIHWIIISRVCFSLVVATLSTANTTPRHLFVCTIKSKTNYRGGGRFIRTLTIGTILKDDEVIAQVTASGRGQQSQCRY